jgi:hypothetical protein
MPAVLTRATPARQDVPFPRRGRSERGGEEVQTSLRVNRSPFTRVLATGNPLK